MAASPALSASPIIVRPVEDAGDRKEFVDFAWTVNGRDPNWIPPLKTEVHSLIDPRTNPWFEHAEARLFLAEREGKVVGRISAHLDSQVLAMPESQGGGPGTGHWGMLEAADQEAAQALIARAEDFLRGRRCHRAMGPFSLSIWDEPGLLVSGFDHPPTVMMGHNSPAYQGWVEAAGYTGRQGPVHLRASDRQAAAAARSSASSQAASATSASASAASTRAGSTRRRS
jgi:hypothetical protein